MHTSACAHTTYTRTIYMLASVFLTCTRHPVPAVPGVQCSLSTVHLCRQFTYVVIVFIIIFHSLLFAVAFYSSVGILGWEVTARKRCSTSTPLELVNAKRKRKLNSGMYLANKRSSRAEFQHKYVCIINLRSSSFISSFLRSLAVHIFFFSFLPFFRLFLCCCCCSASRVVRSRLLVIVADVLLYIHTAAVSMEPAVFLCAALVFFFHALFICFSSLRLRLRQSTGGKHRKCCQIKRFHLY